MKTINNKKITQINRMPMDRAKNIYVIETGLIYYEFTNLKLAKKAHRVLKLDILKF